MKFFIYTIVGVVVAAVVAGFFIIGSPQHERLRQYDERRISDLQFLQSEILNYWMQKATLPQTLDMLRDDIRGTSIPTDPENGINYGYKVKSKTEFSLCAVFDLPKQISPPARRDFYYSAHQQWEHLRGENCFLRTIDKAIYKPQKLQ